MHRFWRRIIGIPVLTAILVFAIYMLVYFYNKLPIVCSDIAALENLMRIDLSNVEIVNIQSSVDEGYTNIVIFAKADEAYLNNEYFESTNYSNVLDRNFEWLTTSDIEMLEQNSLQISDIRQYGISYGDVRNGMSYVSFRIQWYELDNQRGENANVIFSTMVPRRVKIARSICG